MIYDLVSLLSSVTTLSESSVRRIIHTAPQRYKIYRIPKRSGGVRTIAHPARELKLLQRAMVDKVLADLPVHQCATAYRAGMSLMDNVVPHAVNNGAIVKMDLKDFFPSIRAKDWISYAQDIELFNNPSDLHLSALLMFSKYYGDSALRLSVGAPSSPILSNILMYKVDQRIFENLSERYVAYTRYADDMTFSAPRTGFLQTVVSDVTKIIRETEYPKLDINTRKTRFVTKKYHRNITGLVVSNEGVVTVGQLRKRNIRSGMHHFISGDFDAKRAQILMGHIAFAESVESGFFEKLSKKYGSDVMNRLSILADQAPTAPA